MNTQKRRLMWHGMLLFLFGLITGLLEQRFTNVRLVLPFDHRGSIQTKLFGWEDVLTAEPFYAGPLGVRKCAVFYQ